jgi:hypothetical protein
MRGTIAVPNEVDVYSVHLWPNTNYTAVVQGLDTGSANGLDLTLPDPFIVVVDIINQTPVTFQDTNAEGGRDPAVVFTVPQEGDYEA